MILEIKDLHVEVEGNEIIKGINLKINEGEFHVLMGPNGSGKTTLAKAIMGYPLLKITKGEILVDEKNINDLEVNERAKLGIFLQFQNPLEIEGVGFTNFMKSAKEELVEGTINMKEMVSDIKSYGDRLKMKEGLVDRNLNQGLSGGERKKSEILQMALLKPKLSILDEPDSGLDIDSIKAVAEAVDKIADERKMSILCITHYSRILNYMKPKFVHVIKEGKIVAQGGQELIEKLEKEGYKAINE